jgi:fimbrial isopeptide formation D2 family protein
VSGHSYEAYQIFKGDVSGSTLSNVEWGDGISDEGKAALLKYASDNVNKQNTANANEGETPATVSYTKVSELVDYLMTIEGDLPSDFTKLAGEYLVSDQKILSGNLITASTDNGVKTPAHYEISDLIGGYYLVKQADDTIDLTADESYTNYMVRVAGDTTMELKTGTPEIQKKVLDNDSENETWLDTADYNIGDPVPFQLTATVANNYSTYSEYKLVIHDTASGLTFDKDNANFKVYIVNNNTPTDVTTDFTTAISNGAITVTEGTEKSNPCIFEITFKDLKTFSDEVNDSSKIVINYTATLNSNAVIGSTGNPNKTWLVYSNNPYDTKSTGKTPEDQVIVYTYKLIVNKVDGKTEQSLSGAAFSLYPVSGSAISDVSVGAVTVTSGSTFTFSGIDAGTYVLKETTVPEGYNKMEDITLTIEAKHTTDLTEVTSGSALTSLKASLKSGSSKAVISKSDDITAEDGTVTITGSPSEGSITATIANYAGSMLPSAGGMGTRLLYLIGALLVLFAGTMLIAKKRTGSDR